MNGTVELESGIYGFETENYYGREYINFTIDEVE